MTLAHPLHAPSADPFSDAALDARIASLRATRDFWDEQTANALTTLKRMRLEEPAAFALAVGYLRGSEYARDSQGIGSCIYAARRAVEPPDVRVFQPCGRHTVDFVCSCGT